MIDYTETVTKLRDVYRAYVATGNEKAGQFLADAAAAIEALEARLGEAENSVERWKDMYLTKHEPKRGKWIVDGMYTYNLRELNGKAYEPVYRCSCCNRQMESYLRLDEPKMPEDADFPEYCPHCGAKMEVQDG